MNKLQQSNLIIDCEILTNGKLSQEDMAFSMEQPYTISWTFYPFSHSKWPPDTQ